MSRIQRSPPSRSDIPHTLSDSDVRNLVEHDEKKTNPSQRNKIPRKSCCEELFRKLKEEMKSMILDVSNNQTLSLDKLIKDVAEIKVQNSAIQKSNQEIEKSLQFLSDQYDNLSLKVDALDKERKDHLLHISTLEAKVEDIQRSLKSTTIELRNIPSPSKTENVSDLCSVLQNTCRVLNVELNLNDIKDVFRVKGKAGMNTIVANFTRTSKKHEVVKSAKVYNRQHPNDRLNSSHIGLPGSSVPVYISEGLTGKGRRLLYLARDFATSAEYKYCWTSNGKVYIRKADNSPHIEIKTEAVIMNLKNSK